MFGSEACQGVGHNFRSLPVDPYLIVVLIGADRRFRAEQVSRTARSGRFETASFPAAG